MVISYLSHITNNICDWQMHMLGIATGGIAPRQGKVRQGGHGVKGPLSRSPKYLGYKLFICWLILKSKNISDLLQSWFWIWEEFFQLPDRVTDGTKETILWQLKLSKALKTIWEYSPPPFHLSLGFTWVLIYIWLKLPKLSLGLDCIDAAANASPRHHGQGRPLDCAFEDATVSYDTQTYLDETTHLSATQTVKCEDMLHELIQLSLTPSTRWNIRRTTFQTASECLWGSAVSPSQNQKPNILEVEFLSCKILYLLI